MTKTEHARRARLSEVLHSLGFTEDEGERLRRISRTLQRWHELECGTGSNHADHAIERDPDGAPYMVTHLHGQGVSKTYRRRVADRETGALRRLAQIVDNCNKARRTAAWEPLSYYIQTDPRGAALYILRPGDIPEGLRADSCYTRGICIY